jgi:hypothetical protein
MSRFTETGLLSNVTLKIKVKTQISERKKSRHLVQRESHADTTLYPAEVGG